MARFYYKNIYVQKVVALDTNYIEELLRTLKNQFWKDVLTSLIKISQKLEMTEENILKIPTFYNSNICIDKKYIFWTDWYNKGIRFLNDLVKENGDFYSQQELIEKYNINTIFFIT